MISYLFIWPIILPSYLFINKPYHHQSLHNSIEYFEYYPIQSIEQQMGANESIDKDIIQYKNHARIGIYKHLQYNGDRYVEIHRQLPNQKIFNDWIHKVKNVKLSMVGSDVVYLPVKENYNATQLCGSGGTLKIIFEEWENFLKDEITNRRKNQNFYLQEEIWFIMYSLVKVGLLYEGKNTKLGDMHPNNIIVTPQGFIKVITKDSFPLELNNFEKIVEEIKTDVYLAPEQMDEQMIESGVYSIKQASKSDAFSFGITMLETITLQNCIYLYIRNPLRISYQKLEIYTNIMRERYSQELHQIVLSVLEINPNKRKGFLQIYQLLRPHEEKILDMQPFSLKNSQVNKPVNNRKQLSMSQSHIPQQNKSINGSVKVPFSPPTQQTHGKM